MISVFRKLKDSVSFVPSVIALGFGAFALFLIFVPKFNSNSEFLKFVYVEDKSDIQFILTYAIGGIITLTIFSFSMVMTTINQSISSYSPRIIPLILAARDNQYILGFTSGSVVYSLVMSLFLVNTKVLQFPKLAAFFAILFCIISVILFIYFIHSVTQSIHINHLLRQSFDNTKNNIKSLNQFQQLRDFKSLEKTDTKLSILHSSTCGYLSMPNLEKLNTIASKHQLQIFIRPIPGKFIYENDEICVVIGKISEKIKSRILTIFRINKTEPMDVPAIGLKHLVEVAIRASAPGEKDIGTSIAAIHYFTQLAIYRKEFGDNFMLKAKDNYNAFVAFKILDFATLISYSFKEMETYMKDDPLLMEHLTSCLSKIKNSNKTNKNVNLAFGEILNS